MLLLARIVHIAGGVSWAGAIFFLALFLFPAVKQAGHDGSAVVVALARQRVLDIVPVIAMFTMVSGFYMYWRSSISIGSSYMQSGTGVAYGIGAVATVIAFITGASFIRPTMKKAMALSQRASSVSATERDALLTQAELLEVRGGRAARVVALLLGIAVVAMSVARYV
ncbi:MAG: hypothetical protein ABIS03_08530 [Gemmatimonadaceae bacterium]